MKFSLKMSYYSEMPSIEVGLGSRKTCVIVDGEVQVPTVLDLTTDENLQDTQESLGEVWF